MTSQLGDILGYMELLGELDTEQVEPMAHALDVSDVFRDDAVRPSLDRAGGAGERPQARRRVLPGSRRAGRSRDGHSIDLRATELLAAACLGPRHGRSKSPGRFSTRSQARRRREGVSARRSAGGAGPGGGDRPAACGGRAAGPLGRPARGRQGPALHPGRADHLRLADAGELPPALRRHGRRPAEGGRRRADRARRTWTSSPWAGRRRTRPSS